MKKIIAVLIVLMPMMAFAAIGPNVSQTNGEELKWEEGAWDYFVMFKSLIDQVTGEVTTTPGNPQADSCLDFNTGSTFTLTSDHVPSDTNIDRAFLIWISAQDPSNFNGPTDNSVALSFTNSANPAVALSTDVVSSVSGNLFTPPSFDYEAISDNSDSTGIFTYRVDVTDFMQQIIELGALNEIPLTGEALYGDYNVKGMDCTRNQAYLTTSGMVGAWALVFVYTSEKISPKKIYFYNGMEAYRFTEGIITVSGFELPNEAEVRLSMIVAEGDPGLASATTDTFQPAGPEALALKGQSAANFELLWNDCNPPKFSPLNYTEVYNSISSMYPWNADFPSCIGGDPNSPNPDMLEYAVDADTFLLKAKDFPFSDHLKKGDTQFSLKIGANQDQVYTNLLVVSVDTKAPKFDIPVNPGTPDGREKNYCSCSTDADAVCFDRPFYYLIKIQNWGENIAENVKLQDSLPNTVEYVSGTTEIAKSFKDGVGTDWTKVDDVDGKFPFASAVQVSDLMGYCDKGTFDCPDTVMVRFAVKPKSDIPKHEIIKNSAVLTDAGNIPYNTNSNIALRLKSGNCPAITACNLPPKSECGGVNTGEKCEDKGDCEENQECIDNQCVDKEEAGDLTSNAKVTFGAGPNSPDSDTTVVIPSPKDDIVAGQLYLYSEGNKGKFYNVSGISIKFTYDSDVAISNIRLVYDKNGNGKMDSDESVLSSLDKLSNANYAEFNIMNPSDRLAPADQKNYYLIVVNALTNITSGRAGGFMSQIENAEAIRVEDSGAATVEGNGFKFATFRFEPLNGFIFTKGENDPQVPAFSMINSDNPLLQVRTKSMQGGDAIKSIPVKAPAGFVKFGEGIKSITLLLDNDKDGKDSSSDTVIQKISVFDSPTTATFSDLESYLTYSEGEEKYLLFKCEFAMTDGEKAKITISRLTINTEREIAELPVSSKEISYVCDKSDPNSCTDIPSGKDDGCSITAVESSSWSFAGVLAILMMLLVSSGRFRKD